MMRKDLFKPSSFNLIKAFFIVILFSGTANVYAQTIFKDDFNRDVLGSAWQTDNWSIVNGSAFNGNGGPLATSTAFADSSYIIETAAMGFTSDYHRDFRITFAQADLSDQKAYVIRYSEEYGSTLTLGRSTDNIFYPIILDQAGIYPAFNDTQWYKFKVARYKSGLIQVYVDKGSGYGATPLLEAIDSAYQTLGHFGWREDTETSPVGFYVDYIKARNPVNEKPAVREKPVEDSLIMQVDAKSPRAYNVAKLNTGVNEFTDRDYKITSLPSYLNGASFVQTAMDDKFRTSDDFLSLFVKKDAVIYIAYDPRATAIPGWLTKWTKTGDIIETTDSGSSYLEVYSRLIQSSEVYPFPLLLGGNLASPGEGARMNYLVAAVEKPNFSLFQAEDALLSGPVVANNFTGYTGTGFADYLNQSDDYIEWTVNIAVPGTYHLGFNYANAGITDRPLQISADGTDISIIPFSNTGTSSWATWSFTEGPDIFLTPGVHKIRATATGFSGPNMDALSLYYSSSAPPVTSARRGFANTQIAGELFDNSAKAFPNPFTESVKITYTLKEKAKVVLSVYSLQGQQLQLLVNGVREKGTYQANFNAGKLSAGIYFYRLQIGNEIKTGKLLKN